MTAPTFRCGWRVQRHRDDLFSSKPYTDLLALAQLAPCWTCWICGSEWLGDIAHDCPAARKPDPVARHWLMVGILKAYRLRPHQLGLGYPPCACHPAPNPAARDYRRRTKHRNRRRK